LYDTTGNPPVASAVFPDDELRSLLQRLVRLVRLLEPDRPAHDHGGVSVTTSEVFALGELTEAGSLSQLELGARLGLEKSTVSRLAAAMQDRGWLARDREPGNRRLYRLSLTALGKDAARRVGDDLRVQHGRLLATLSPAERQGLAVGLAGLFRAMEEHGRSHHHG
jgi:DNA-binding MarR family transcriptional regulator